MEEVRTDDLKKKRFLWGLALAWIPSLPLFYNAFKGIELQKATGLGAVAGGLSEVACTLGIAMVFIIPATAIVLLTRSFSGGHGTRKMLSLISIAWSALILFLAGSSVWLFFFHLPAFSGKAFFAPFSSKQPPINENVPTTTAVVIPAQRAAPL